MNAKSFLKNALLLILVLAGVFYVASAFFVSKTVSQAFYNPRHEVEDALSRVEFELQTKILQAIASTDDAVSRLESVIQAEVTKAVASNDVAVARIEAMIHKKDTEAVASNEVAVARIEDKIHTKDAEGYASPVGTTLETNPDSAKVNPDKPPLEGEGAKGGNRQKDQPGTAKTFYVGRFVRGAIQLGVFAVLLALPIGIAYRFLVLPLKEFPLVSPDVLSDVASDDDVKKEAAATVIIKAMILSGKGRLAKLAEDDEDRDDLEGDIDKLESALHFPVGRATAVRAVLERRETQASNIAKRYAAMAGLTVAISSSAMGDGIGMFFWKARLVHDTIKTYGFRPDSWSVARIYAYVLFASFLAASIEDLCEMLDASELAGGFVLRVVQGVVGAAVVLKGGQLTRSYLTKGITKESRDHAIANFKVTAKEDLKSVADSIGESLGKIGLKSFA